MRSCVRMISVAQPHAGAWLNAVPSRRAFRINSWAMRIAVQRRLGLPLTAHAASGSEGRGKHGQPFDVMGDLAQNDGEEGHQTRHWLVLVATEVAHALSLPTARDPRARGAGG